MRRLLVLCAGMLLILSADCIVDGGGDFPGEYLDSYFPLNPKLVRKYLVTTYSDSLKTLSKSKRTFTGRKNIDGKTYYILESEGSDRPSYYRRENDILYRYYFDGEKLNVPYSHEEPLLDFTKQPGESWVVVASTITEPAGETSYKVESTYRGIEMVETIGGTFVDCARFDTLEQVVLTPSDRAVYPLTLETQYRSWYALGIGLVKTIAEGNLLGTHVVELYSYSL